VGNRGCVSERARIAEKEGEPNGYDGRKLNGERENNCLGERRPWPEARPEKVAKRKEERFHRALHCKAPDRRAVELKGSKEEVLLMLTLVVSVITHWCATPES
jgi:hypothetical protein